MTEINNTLRSSPNTGSSRGPTNAEANTIRGLGSGLDTQRTINTLIQVERMRLQPVENRRAESQIELDAFKQVKEKLETFKDATETLAERAIWEGKLVESNNPEVVTAIGTAGAKPGKHTLIVDRLALNHQRASQGFAAPEDIVGTGNFQITIGEEDPVTIVLDETNDTLTGLKDAINNATEKIRATIIKTAAKDRPYQLVLTSQETGSVGRINLEIALKDGEAPNFENAVDEASAWKGVGAKVAPVKVPTGVGASTTIVRVIGDYTGEEDREFSFTATQTGIVGGENALQLRWQDDTGRSGTLELDSFNYAPGEPIEFADGLSLIISQGEIIVGDQFSVRARAEKSSLFWWLAADERAAAFSQPSPWRRQADFGAPVIEGPYTGEEEQTFKLTVVGSGQVGVASDLAIRWESEEGDTGFLRVGRGYAPGSKLALTDGLTLGVQPGVLAGGQSATFRVIPAEISSRWWLDDAEREIPSEILDVTNFTGLEEVEEEELELGVAPEFPEELGPRISTPEREVTGDFEGDESKVYTFTASRDGTVGTTRDLTVRWEDGKGNSGVVALGDQYLIGSPASFDAGLAISFGPGRIFEDDTFTVRTRTSTIQPAQDARIRFGATELGGGLEITNATNELEGVIEGVKLTLVSTSETPVTVTIKGDTENAFQSILSFAEQFNELAGLINELTKFDSENELVGPLLGDRNLTQIRDDVTRTLIDSVDGLPKTLNMLAALGLKIDDKGLLAIDSDALKSDIEDDFGAVADVFRERGQSDNTGISFISMTEDTRPNEQGYEVDISRVATRGEYDSPVIQAPIVIDGTNDTFFITVDGRKSEEIKLEQKSYTLTEYARSLQNQITNDEVIGSRRVRVVAEDGRIRVISGRFGSNSTISFSPTTETRGAGVALLDGESVPGQDVAGTINGETAKATGQLLSGSDESTAVKGLRLFIGLAESQLAPNAAEGRVKITKGVASKLRKLIGGVLDPNRGNMKRITEGLRTQIKNIDGQLETMNERIERKKIRLQRRFAKMETQLSTLRTQQSFISSSIGGLPSGGGRAGLPGL